MAALVTTAGVYAQKTQVAVLPRTQSVVLQSGKNFYNKPVMPGVVSKAPNRTFATGLYYNRPVGTYYYPTPQVTYLIAPPFVELAYRNQSVNKTGFIWHDFNFATPVRPAEANGDYKVSYPRIDSEGGAMLLPSLVLGTDSFQIGDGNGSQYTNLVIQQNAASDFTYLDLATLGGYYNGFSVDLSDPQGSEYAFGTKVASVYHVEENGDTITNTYHENGIMQIFDKPASPLVLNSVLIPGITSDPDSTAINEGAELTLMIIPFNENAETFDEALSAEPLATWKCKASDVVYGTSYILTGTEAAGNARKAKRAEFNFSEKATVFGQETNVPVVIDQPFAIKIDGFANEGVNLGFSLADNGENLPEYNIVRQTYTSYSDMEGYASSRGRHSGGYYSYQTPMYLNGYMDVVMVDTMEQYNVLTAPAEGGEALNTTGVGALVYTLEDVNDDSGNWNETYKLVQADGSDVPSWITFSGDDSFYAEQGFYLVNITAEASTEARTATLYLENTVTGVRSENPIYVLQNTTEVPTGINAVTSVVNAKTSDVIYNVAGQKVSKDYKGLVIKNGKKSIQK